MEADREATPTLNYIRTTRENICSFYNFITRARGLLISFPMVCDRALVESKLSN
jgi:hypothetical protein